MGWWNTLIQGASQVAGFVANNAGSISTAAKIIGGFAGLVLTDDMMSPDAGNIFPLLAESADAAEQFIVKEARKRFPGSTADAADKVVQSKTYELTGCWANLAATPSAHSAPSIIQDVHKFLAEKRFPPTVTFDDQTYDLGQAIVDKMTTSDREQYRYIHKSAGGEYPYYAVPVTLNYGDTYVQGGFVYYEIPLGNNDSHHAWHACLRMSMSLPKQKNDALRKHQQEHAMLPVKAALSLPFNKTTISSVFSGAKNVWDIMNTVYNAFNQTKGASLEDDKYNPITDMEITEPPFINGTGFTFQITSKPNVGQNTVQDVFSGLLDKHLPVSEIPRFPVVRIENHQTYTDDVKK